MRAQLDTRGAGWKILLIPESDEEKAHLDESIRLGIGHRTSVEVQAGYQYGARVSEASQLGVNVFLFDPELKIAAVRPAGEKGRRQ